MGVTGITDINDQIVLGIIGDPIKQVKSPFTFGEYFRLHGINAVMVPLHVGNDDFQRVLEGLREVKNFGGTVITIPYKGMRHIILRFKRGLWRWPPERLMFLFPWAGTNGLPKCWTVSALFMPFEGGVLKQQVCELL
jgi:hypothetical protein